MAHGYLGDGYGVDQEFGPRRGEGRGRERHEADWRSSDRSRARMFGRWNGGFLSEDRANARQNFSSNPDDHYRSWRDRHMSELDRDYAEYCREREEQFRRDFDTWRNQRHGSAQPLQSGMSQTGLSADPTGVAQAEPETLPALPEAENPTRSATLGTNSRGRGRG